MVGFGRIRDPGQQLLGGLRGQFLLGLVFCLFLLFLGFVVVVVGLFKLISWAGFPSEPLEGAYHNRCSREVVTAVRDLEASIAPWFQSRTIRAGATPAEGRPGAGAGGGAPFHSVPELSLT